MIDSPETVAVTFTLRRLRQITGSIVLPEYLTGFWVNKQRHLEGTDAKNPCFFSCGLSCSWCRWWLRRQNFILGWFSNRTRTSVDNGARIKNTHTWVEIDSRSDYSTRSRVLEWRSRSVAKSDYSRADNIASYTGKPVCSHAHRKKPWDETSWKRWEATIGSSSSQFRTNS